MVLGDPPEPRPSRSGKDRLCPKCKEALPDQGGCIHCTPTECPSGAVSPSRDWITECRVRGTSPTFGASLQKALPRRYELESILGSGGMGVVFLARDRRLERRVAVKVLVNQSKSLSDMFKTEARILAGLEHDNIVRVYDYGFAETSPYLVMEYLRGRTLATRLAAGRPTLVEAVKITLDILKGVSEAHKNGIVHRDLKPANVFIEESGRVKVGDFGLACRVGPEWRMSMRPERRASVPVTTKANGDSLESATFNGSGNRIEGAPSQCGTPGYMSPEQRLCRPIGSESDIYSVGLILYEMLAGQRLFQTIDPKTYFSEPSTPKTPPSHANPCVPDVLDRITSRALSDDPIERPDAQALTDLLQSWLDGALGTPRRGPAGGLPSHPYKFLEHYGPSDQEIFFGRDAEIGELLELIESSSVRLVLLFGPCGIGKSSLLHAGLAPALDPLRYEPILLTSGPDPARLLREAVGARARARCLVPSDQNVSGPLDPGRGRRAIEDLLVSLERGTGRCPVLILDQLEELFTQNERDSSRGSDFFWLIQELAQDQLTPVKLVLSFRTEFRGNFFPLEERLGHLQRSMRLREIQETSLPEVIVGPSRRPEYGFGFEEGFPARLAAEVIRTTRGAGDATLPVLQIVLRQVYDRMKEVGSRTIGWDLFESTVGGVKEALRRYVEERLSLYAHAHGGAIARQIIKALTVKEGGERYARARDEEELLAFPDREAARRILELLISDHLVVRNAGFKGASQIRLASEVICSIVDQWALEDSEVDRAARTLSRLFRQWREGGGRDEDLISGSALRLVGANLMAMNGLTDEERGFVQAGIARQRSRSALLAIGFGLVAGLVVSVLYVACWRPGTLVLDSEPRKATVLLEDRPLGQTPLRWEARPGVYTLVLKKDRHDPAKIDVRIPAGNTVEYRPVLRYPFGILSVGSAPSGATCEVFREPRGVGPAIVGRTPFTTELESGRYSLTLRLPGCLDKTVPEFSLGANRELIHTVVPLEKNTGHLTVFAPGQGNRLLLKQEKTGRVLWSGSLPLAGPLETAVGRYSIDCLSQYGSRFTTSVEVSRGTTVSRTVWIDIPRLTWVADVDDAVPGGPALADFDGDGVPDAAVATEQNVVAISGGAMRALWRCPTTGTVSSAPAVGDLDQDGVPDVVVGSDSGRVQVVSGRLGTRLWTVEVGGPIRASPGLGDLDSDKILDVVIGSRDGKVYALSGKTGSPIWTYATGKGVVSSPALHDLDGDRSPDVVIGSDDQFVHAISGKTGRRLWSTKTGGPVQSSPALGDLDHDGIVEVVIGSNDRKVYVLDSRNGRPLWFVRTGGNVVSSPALADLDRDGTPDIVVGSHDHSVYAISGRTRKPLWTFTAQGQIQASPVVGDVNGDGQLDVVVGSNDRVTYVIDGRTGTRVFALQQEGSWSAPAALADVDGDRISDVIFGTYLHKIKAFSMVSQRTFWTFRTADDISDAPSLADLDGDGRFDVVIGTESGHVQALSGRSGLPLWVRKLESQIATAPGLAQLDGDGILDPVFGTTLGFVHALSGRTGQTIWSHQASHGVCSQFAIADVDQDGVDDVVVGTEEGEVLAVSGRSGKRLWSESFGVSVIAQPLLPDLDKDRIPDLVVVTTQGQVRALSGKGHKPLWAFTIPGKIRASPVLADLDRDGVPDMVVGGLDGHGYAISGKNGRLIWRVPLGHQSWFSPAVADLNLDGVPDAVFETRKCQLLALSGVDGSLIWKYETRGDPVSLSLAYVDSDTVPDVVVASSDSHFHLVSGRTGERLYLTNLFAGSMSFSPYLVDLELTGIGTSRPAWDGLNRPIPTHPGPGPRSLAFLGQSLGTTLTLRGLPWPLRPAQVPKPAFFTNSRVLVPGDRQ